MTTRPWWRRLIRPALFVGIFAIVIAGPLFIMQWREDAHFEGALQR